LFRKSPERKGQCLSCGACCKVVRITAVLDTSLRQHGNLEELKRYYSYRGIRVVEADRKANKLYYEMDLPCSQLTPDNKCAVHGRPELRPLLCEKYPWFRDNIETCGYRFE